MIAKRHLFLAVGKLIGIYAAVRFSNSIELVLWVLLVLDVCQVLVMHLVFGKKHFWIKPWCSKVTSVGKILRYGVPMALYSITSIIARDIDKLVVGRFSGTEVMAIYSNCSKLLPFDMLASSVATILIPYIVRSVHNNETENAVGIFKNYLRVTYYTVWCLASVSILFSDEIICFLYSEDFLAGKTIFIVYMLDTMMRFSSVHLVMTAAGATKELFGYSLITMLANCILSVGLYFLVGVPGPALATLITTGIYTLMVLQKSCSILQVSLSKILDIKEILLLAIKIIIGVCFIWLIRGPVVEMDISRNAIMFAGIALFGGYYVLVNWKNLKEIWLNINQIKTSEQKARNLQLFN